MRIRLDTDACTGHGRCYTVAPAFFSPDDDGYCQDPVIDVPTELVDVVRRAVANCPEEALSIEE